MRGKHDLPFEPEQVERRRPVGFVESTQRLNFFGVRNERVTHGDLCSPMFVAVTVALVHDDRHFFVSDDRSRVAHQRNVGPELGVGVAGQKVRQFHDVAVGIENRPGRWRVRHGRTVPGRVASTPLGLWKIRR